MTVGGNKFNRCQFCGPTLDDPNFTVDSHGGYCTVRIADSLSVVVINETSFVIVEVYRNTEDDAPIDSMVFSKGDHNNE